MPPSNFAVELSNNPCHLHVDANCGTPVKSLSPPVASDEILVSSVIELSHDGPSNLEYRENFEGISFNVALLHSAPYLEGYEVVIKQLTDQENNEWKELKTENTWHGSGTVMLL